MTKKIGDKKVRGVKSTTGTKEVEGAESVTGVSGVKATTGVGAVKGAGSVGRARSLSSLTMAQREQLFNMIDEEANKLFAASGMPEKERLVAQRAVKMVIDAGLLDMQDEEEDKR